ncbi:MAG: HU family DNA-binding protein [Chloroflexi bacterium]|nr:HU family DNA-binding protein [Chloroflexota bacterium]
MAVKAKEAVVGKKELVEELSKKTKLTKKDSEMAINAVLEIITSNLKKKKSIRLIPFGSFEVRSRAGRTGRNPRTGEKIKIKARKVPAFRPGKALREAVK